MGSLSPEVFPGTEAPLPARWQPAGSGLAVLGLEGPLGPEGFGQVPPSRTQLKRSLPWHSRCVLGHRPPVS